MVSALLDLLRDQLGQWLSIEAMQKALALSAEGVNAQVAQLRTMGYVIESSREGDFRLTAESEKLDRDIIACGLDLRRLGEKILVYECVDSTNDIAWQHANEPDHDGMVVFAEQQRKGRGRLGRVWSSPRGSSILCSVLLHKVEAMAPQALPLLIGLAAAQAIDKLLSRPISRIKWPNDVTINGRKIAGTMLEARRTAIGMTCVLGIGINCRQQRDDFEPELRDTATSLAMITGAAIDRMQLARYLLSELDNWITLAGQGQNEKLHQAWLRYCDDIGRSATLINNGQAFTGRIVDVAPETGLLLQIEHGPVKVFDAATTTVDR